MDRAARRYARKEHRPSVSHGNTPDGAPIAAPDPPAASENELVTTLFDLGRQITSVLDFDELLRQIPKLIGRLISFDAFAVYLLEERRGELRLEYAVGYPEPERAIRLAPLYWRAWANVVLLLAPASVVRPCYEATKRPWHALRQSRHSSQPSS